MRGEYRVKNPGLQPLYEEARSLMRRIGRVTFEHVRREFNTDADRLAERGDGRSGRFDVNQCRGECGTDGESHNAG